MTKWYDYDYMISSHFGIYSLHCLNKHYIVSIKPIQTYYLSNHNLSILGIMYI
jgi:hypothetical protein